MAKKPRKRRPQKWQKQTMRLSPDHNWKATPGYNVFVANRGEVMFNIPHSWVVLPDEESIKIYNRAPPDDDCRLQLTVIHTPPGIDWRDLPLTAMLLDATKDEDGDTISRSPVTQLQRPGADVVWLETRFLDPNEKREACSRTAFARGGTAHALLTLEFWPEDLDRFGPAWDELLRSLRVGEYIIDPRSGPAPRPPRYVG